MMERNVIHRNQETRLCHIRVCVFFNARKNLTKKMTKIFKSGKFHINVHEMKTFKNESLT